MGEYIEAIMKIEIYKQESAEKEFLAMMANRPPLMIVKRCICCGALADEIDH